MSELVEWTASNAALLVALLALLVSLRANFMATRVHQFNLKNEAEKARLRFAEGKRALLNEIDHQHARIGTLSMLTAQKVLLFREHPSLHTKMQDEFDRLKSNLQTVQRLESGCNAQRTAAESLDDSSSSASQEALLADVRRLTIAVEKEILHEQMGLAEVRASLGAPGRN